jgi:hypothetical protein
VLAGFPQALGMETRGVLARFVPFMRVPAAVAVAAAAAEGLPR